MDEKPMQKIRVNPALTFAELQREIAAGGRFVAFPYCISPIAVTQRRYSPAIFIPADGSVKPYQRKYNLLSLLFGWWGLPWGPDYTIGSIRATLQGGTDMTADVMLHLDEASLQAGEYEILQTTQFFCEPGKWDRREMVKAFRPLYDRDYNIRKIVIGYYINTEAPYYVIGIEYKPVTGFNRDYDFETLTDVLRTALNKRFKKSMPFGYLELGEDDEICKILEEQGDTLFSRKIYQ